MRRGLPFFPAAMAVSLMLAFSANAAPLSMTVDAAKTGAPINPLIYGQFTENANSNFYRGGLWAELLDDRKFYFPIIATPATAPPVPVKQATASSWRPVGGTSVVSMDTQRPYSGKQSAKIALDAAAPHGVRQGGLVLQNGKAYTGRIVLAADPGVEVQVSLVWGPGPADRQTVTVGGAGAQYRTFPLAFTSGAATTDAAFEIVATGAGSFNIGAVSLMPADNVQGWRADSVRALREIAPTIIRYGGNFISDYEWRFGVGDRDQRPSTFDLAWVQMDTNDVGTDEILALIRLIGGEPHMNVNAGYGDANSAAQWLEYVNGAATTPMGKQRAENGHPDPYKVKWWNIGNEMYGRWQMGQMQIEHYAHKHNLFAEAMRKVDPTITIVAVGATPAEMSTTGSAKNYGATIVEFGSAQDWNAVMLKEAAGNFDYLAEHLYPKGDQAFDAEQGKFVPVEESLTDHARRLPNRVKTAAEAWQEYQRRFPDRDMKKIQIALDEWRPGAVAGQRVPMYGPLSSAEALNELSRNSEWFVLANFTHLTGLVAGRAETTILPIGRVFQLYRNHFGTIPVAVTGNAPQPELKGVVNVDKPKVSSGSATYPLDVAAALSADRKTLTVAVVNPTQSEQQIAVNFAGVRIAGGGKLLRIVGGDAAPAAGQPPPATPITQTALPRAPSTLTVPKLSISMYVFPVR